MPEREKLQALTLAYDALARLMPVEGRDFTLKVIGDPLRVRLTGLTPFGITFAEYCHANLQRTMDEIAAEQGAPMPTKAQVMSALAESLKKGKINGRVGGKCNTRSNGTCGAPGGGATGGDEQSVL